MVARDDFPNYDPFKPKDQIKSIEDFSGQSLIQLRDWLATNPLTNNPITSIPWANITGRPSTFPPDPLSVKTKTVSYSLTGNDDVILADATAGNVTIGLPAASLSSGKTYVVKRLDASVNTVTVDANAAEVIDNAATYDLAGQYDSVTIVCDGSKWWVI